MAHVGIYTEILVLEAEALGSKLFGHILGYMGIMKNKMEATIRVYWGLGVRV